MLEVKSQGGRNGSTVSKVFIVCCFMAALSGYDQCLVEDRNANQMHEALTLFDSLVNGEYFRNRFGLCDLSPTRPLHSEVQALSVIPILLEKHDMPASTATWRRVRQCFCKMHGYVTDVDCSAVA